MYIDERLLFSDAQAFTSTATHASDDLFSNPTGKDVFGTSKNMNAGKGGNMFIHAQVHTAFASISGLTSNLVISLQQSPSTTAGSFSDCLKSSDLKVAGLTLGDEWIVGLPTGLDKYLRVAYTVSTQVFSAGAIDAWLSMDPTGVRATY